VRGAAGDRYASHRAIKEHDEEADRLCLSTTQSSKHRARSAALRVRGDQLVFANKVRVQRSLGRVRFGEDVINPDRRYALLLEERISRGERATSDTRPIPIKTQSRTDARGYPSADASLTLQINCYAAALHAHSSVSARLDVTVHDTRHGDGVSRVIDHGPFHGATVSIDGRVAGWGQTDGDGEWAIVLSRDGR